jgi:hypothetical protein
MNSILKLGRAAMTGDPGYYLSSPGYELSKAMGCQENGSPLSS